EKAYDEGYFLAPKKSLLKKLYAYLLSTCNPSIELLIVDEGHNYKQGLGTHDDDTIADRNQVVTRFFGLKRNSEEDKTIFDRFPELSSLVKPKVEKLIVLSATPKTASLLELKYQFDLFLKSHVLSGVKKEEEVKAQLNQFFIRGNMEYAVGDARYTRNLCRHEDRSGGVTKGEETKGLQIESHDQAIVLGLLQYKTIKHLGTKHNASFELGMLAGFETFRLDQEKRSVQQQQTLPDGEYEEVRTRKTRTSQDYSVLKTLIESYKDRFDGELPPHPKQDALVDAAFDMMREGEKSLIFVRRVASADELERRLLDRWEGVIYEDLKTKWKKRLPSEALTQLVDSYTERKANRKLSECIHSILNGVAQKLLAGKAQYPLSFLTTGTHTVEDVLLTGLHYLYNHYRYIERGESFHLLLNRHCDLSIIKTELVQLAYGLLQEHQSTWQTYVGGSEEEEGEEGEVYFFHSYFKQSHTKLFKKRTTATDWFDVNFYLLNQVFQITAFDKELLVKNMTGLEGSHGVKEVQETFLKCVGEEPYTTYFLPEAELPTALTKNTLLTDLLTGLLAEEFRGFLHSLQGKRKVDIFYEIKVLTTILKSCLRNGSGFVPLYLADKSEGDINQNFVTLISDGESVFQLVLKEAKTIIRDYHFLRAVNFPEGETFRQMETKLYFQTPVLGLTGQSKRSKSNVATQFRMPGFPYVLVTTDIFREGEDLHAYCQHIFHYGIAWNCSDMEQRTGRIDRINSLSHRKLLRHQQLGADNQIHVYYPYLKNTLEVNQVSRLFHSINSFTETFNDFTRPVEEEGIAYTGEKVERMPDVIKTPLRSKYDHEQFSGYVESGALLSVNAGIGISKTAVLEQLQELEVAIHQDASFNYGPMLDTEAFTIKGDTVLTNRENRRGPFQIAVKNSVHPGKFIVEVSAYLFKISSKTQRLLNISGYQLDERFTLGSVEDFYALTFTMPLDGLDAAKFQQMLLKLLQSADHLEKELTGDDITVFG
ncbi:MAG: hypothetical protein EOO10_13900, partial [Chitinophagaceae bacterium]